MINYERISKEDGYVSPATERQVRLGLENSVKNVELALEQIAGGAEIGNSFFIYRKGPERQAPQYAPAPWRIDAETPNHAPIITDRDGKGRDLAEIRGESKEERAATARLMAAAPDLLEAMREMVAEARERNRAAGETVFNPAALEAGLAAIAKAEGRS